MHNKKRELAGQGNTRCPAVFCFMVLSEYLFAVFVNLLSDHIIHAVIGTCGKSDGCVGDEIVFSIFINFSFNF